MRDIAGIVVRRLGYGIIALLLLLTAVFFVTRVMRDPVAALAGEDATQETRDALRHSLGLDQPVIVQYVDYLGKVIRGDFGDSYRLGQPAMDLVLGRLPATLSLALVAIVLALIAIPIGVISAAKPGSPIDSFARGFAALGASMPVFWLGILLIIVFSVWLRVLPSGGTGGIEHLILPGLTLSFYSLPLMMRITRSGLLDVLHKDYIRTARAKGLGEWQVIVNHGLRNVMIPIITVLALRLGVIISGAVTLEQVFGYPGLGQLAIRSMRIGDFPVIQAFIVVVGAGILLINLFADLLYQLADPRVRVS
jgi:ABC-type dipeptide/oligopeptide/nickel transport system permease component